VSEIEALRGARLQRIDGPRPDLFAFEVYRPALSGVLVLATGLGEARWGWVDERPRGDPASAFVQQLRKHVENARVLQARADAAGAVLELARGDARPRLILVGTPANLLLELDGSVVGAADVAALRRAGGELGQPAPELAAEAALAQTFAALSEVGPRLVERAMSASVDARRAALRKALRRHVRKLGRRLTKIEGDLARVDEVPGLRKRGHLLVAHLHELPDETDAVELTDWETGAPVTIPIGEGRTPQQEAEALFKRARKLERGGEMAIERHALTEDEIARARSLLEAADGPAEGLDETERAARRLGAVPRPKGARDHASTKRQPFRRFAGTGDRPILVGRSARDNDTVTLAARPWDLWLHARGVTGSHVIVPLGKRETCPAELLIDACHLAAHFSASRGEAVIDVQHTARRHVRKPKGFPAGAVRVEQEKVVALRVERARLTRLLSHEDR